MVRITEKTFTFSVVHKNLTFINIIKRLRLIAEFLIYCKEIKRQRNKDFTLILWFRRKVSVWFLIFKTICAQLNNRLKTVSLLYSWSMKLTISWKANIQAHITRISEEYILLPETDMLAELWKQNVSIWRKLLSSSNASRTRCVYI